MAAERGFSASTLAIGDVVGTVDARRDYQMKLSPIEFTQSQFNEIEAFLAERIYEFNSNATGLFDGEEFAATIRDSDGRIIAGVSGHTWGGCCEIYQLWIHESARQQGAGRSLMLAVEAHARSKNCAQIVLSSHSFQAPVFYRKLGYIEQARISGHPRGHSDIHFTKYLAGGSGV
jgi:ribosomal protein S18 acetylase RimI-like enzyme